MDRVAWRAIVHRVSKSWTLLKRLSMHECIDTLIYKYMFDIILSTGFGVCVCAYNDKLTVSAS